MKKIRNLVTIELCILSTFCRRCNIRHHKTLFILKKPLPPPTGPFPNISTRGTFTMPLRTEGVKSEESPEVRRGQSWVKAGHGNRTGVGNLWKGARLLNLFIAHCIGINIFFIRYICVASNMIHKRFNIVESIHSRRLFLILNVWRAWCYV